MNLDLIVVRLLLNKDLFNQYSKYIDLDFYKSNNQEIHKLLLTLYRFHDTSTEKSTLQDFILFFNGQYPAMKEEQKLFYSTLLDKVMELDFQEDNAITYLNSLRQQSTAAKIAVEALKVSQGSGDLGIINSLMAEIETPITEEEDVYVTTNLTDLVDSVTSDEGLRWRLDTLNKSLGSLRVGDFGFLFARPETGKTTFLASEVTAMASQAAEKGLGPVLWLNNEEQGTKVMTRVYQAYFGVTFNELCANLPEYEEKFQTEIGNHFKMLDMATIRRGDVEKACEELKPSLIIFDQLDKIAWSDTERHDLKMKAIYQWGRELAKQYAPFIAVCQAGGTAEGKKYLTMDDVDSSKTAKQGEADFMIGIGKTHRDSEEYTRFISLCKNKLQGDLDTNAKYRHLKGQVLIKPDVARYEDMVVL